MPKYLIERDLSEAGDLTPEDLQGVAQKSCGVLENLGPEIQWLHSYVADDRITCVYEAANEELIREHARLGGFPCTNVRRIRTRIGPETANTAPVIAAD